GRLETSKGGVMTGIRFSPRTQYSRCRNRRTSAKRCARSGFLAISWPGINAASRCAEMSKAWSFRKEGRAKNISRMKRLLLSCWGVVDAKVDNDPQGTLRFHLPLVR